MVILSHESETIGNAQYRGLRDGLYLLTAL